MAVDRLIGILAILLREEKVTAAQLAARLEVNRRTIYRDMERLCQAGIPLRSDRGRGGGISIMEGYAMDRTLMTEADRSAILAGLRSLDSVSGTGITAGSWRSCPGPPSGGRTGRWAWDPMTVPRRRPGRRTTAW